MHSKPQKTLLLIELENAGCHGWDGICSSPKESICHGMSSGKNDALKGEASDQPCNESAGEEGAVFGKPLWWQRLNEKPKVPLTSRVTLFQLHIGDSPTGVLISLFFYSH